jgi:hypothetical protein
VAVARSLGAGELSEYRVGSLICLLAAAGLAWVLVACMGPRGKQWLLVALLLALVLAGPLTPKALSWGHPEELLGALLCAVALVLARRGQILLAGVSLGLAIATKQWALLAALPVVIVCPGQRRRFLTVTAGVAALFILPMLIGDPNRFLAQNLQIGLGVNNVNVSGLTPVNIWFAYGRAGGVVLGPGGGANYNIPGTLAAVTHPLIFAVGFGLPLLYWWRTEQRSSDDVLLLLALVFLLRNVLDPVTYSYHHLPFLVAIVSYETLRRRGVPIISIYCTAAFWVLGTVHDAATLNKLYLAWALPVVAYLGARLFSQPRQARWVTRRANKPTAAGIASEAT